jgi:hypothetical protein
MKAYQIKVGNKERTMGHINCDINLAEWSVYPVDLQVRAVGGRGGGMLISGS